ncbi:hypothetical protein BDV38DRAFT_295654 [Aspergillus pseudotamarii]|uniref:RelA/SpoT domain-containing protein n=1 Tax=Aspergillus pseudotamarii TaxID=132259 RepID=A0A5N6T670_ASPPS|nr:uncharacterized protein BDV38DRAFT_295654 [Aspergillus pseudotamarii]KAE8141824.1 hypothetical protein BDV38DRAFT_295654 [Aspergillus pseudotamarii]
MTPAVADFVQEYKTKRWIYDRNTAATVKICNEMLQAELLPGVITHRIKEPSSLERKLLQRESYYGRRYPSKEAIQEEIADLAGVRIAVCFPQDIERVHDALCERFDMELKKSYGVGDSSKILQRPGYCATHCWVYLKEDEPQARDGPYRRRVEIQIISMLRHAWSQFEHNAVYKAQSKMDTEDRQILHSLSGAIHRGERLLNCMSENEGVRHLSADLLFELVYEVGCLVVDAAKQETRARGSAKPLEEFLRNLKMARPQPSSRSMVKASL